MQQAQQIYYLDQNEVKLSKVDNRLIIEIEAVLSQRNFSIELDNDAIPQASNEIFANVDVMYNGFEEALKKAYKEVSISFDGSGKLSYKISFSVGSVHREHQFTLSLQEKKLPQITIVEKKLENIQKLMSNLERKQEVLEKANENEKIIEMITNLETRIFEKLLDFENRVSSLEKEKANKEFKSQTELCKSFNRNFPQANDFVFSNDNKTIECKNHNAFEIPILQSLPNSGRARFSIKIEETKGSIWMGIALCDKFNSKFWYRSEIHFSTRDGSIKVSESLSVSPSVNPYQWKKGDLVTMIADLDQGKVSFDVNEIEINSFQVDLKKKTYFPFCGFGHLDNKITLLAAKLEE